MNAPAKVSPLLRIKQWSCITHTYLLHYNGEELLLGNQWFQFQDCLLKACTLQIKVSKRPVFRQILLFSCLIRWTPRDKHQRKFPHQFPLLVRAFHLQWYWGRASTGSYTHHITAVTRQGTQLWVKYELGRWKIHTAFLNKLWLEEDKIRFQVWIFLHSSTRKKLPQTQSKQQTPPLYSSSLHPQWA